MEARPCSSACPPSQQQACGFEYTSKLQRMFQDIGVSKDLNEQFKKHLTNSEPLDRTCPLPAFAACLQPVRPF